MIIAGLDVGGARIGVALGESLIGIASPWGIIEAIPEDRCVQKLRELFDKEGVEKIVVGKPELLKNRGQQTEQQAAIEAWVARAAPHLGRELVYEDETLTSALAATWQREQDGRGKRDDLAAMAILQTYFDKHGNLSS